MDINLNPSVDPDQLDKASRSLHLQKWFEEYRDREISVESINELAEFVPEIWSTLSGVFQAPISAMRQQFLLGEIILSVELYDLIRQELTSDR